MSRVYFSAYATKTGFSEIETATGKGRIDDVKLESEEENLGKALFPLVKKKFKKGKYFYECNCDWTKGKVSDITDEVIVEVK